MARTIKAKKTIELKNQKITFTIEKIFYEVIRFYPTKMTLDVIVFEDGKKQGMQNIPFAHLPKNAKKIIKAN
jgi:hypothetical protein